MDLGRNRSHLTPRQTSDLHQEKNHVPGSDIFYIKDPLTFLRHGWKQNIFDNTFNVPKNLEKHYPMEKLPPSKKATFKNVIGTWNLRNREQLRKRKAEAQEKQTSQWHFGEKKHKRPRTGKGNQRGRKRQHNTELKVEPQSQLEKEMMEKTLAPTEKENELPRSVTEALCLVASPQRVVPEKKISAIVQESTTDQESSSECQEKTVQNHPSEIGQEKAEPGHFFPKMCQEIAVIQDHSSKMCHDMAEPEDLPPKTCQETAVIQDHSSKMCQDVAEPEDLPPKTCQETAVIQDHSSKMCQDVAEPEDLSPKTCQETAVIQDHCSKMCQDVAEPEDLSPKMCQETAVAKALPSKTYEDKADLERRTLEAHPKPDVPEGYALEICPQKAEPKEDTAEPCQEIAGTESCFPKTQQEIAVPENLLTNVYHETLEPEHFSHKAYAKEVTVPKALSHKTVQEMPAPEECPPETCIHRETPGPEDLSAKTRRSKECFPEQNQEAAGPQGQDPKAHQGDVEDVCPPEMKGQPKAQEPETPAIPNLPQEIHPENDVYSYVLF